MHLIRTREIVDWSDIYPPTIDDHTLHNGFNPSSCAYVAWERTFLVISLILNIGVGIVIWRTPLFKGVFLHVIRTAGNNIRRFLLRQDHATETEVRIVNGLNDLSVQENEEGSSRQHSSGIAMHSNAGNEDLVTFADTCIHPSLHPMDEQLVRSISMPVEMSSIDRVISVDTNSSLTISCEHDRFYHYSSVPG